MNYNAQNFTTQNASARKYFTDESWTAFQQAINESGNYKITKESQLIVTAELGQLSSLKIDPQAPYDWSIELPVKMTYQSASRTLKQNLIAKLKLRQDPETHQYKITSFIMTQEPKPESKPKPMIKPAPQPGASHE